VFPSSPDHPNLSDRILFYVVVVVFLGFRLNEVYLQQSLSELIRAWYPYTLNK